MGHGVGRPGPRVAVIGAGWAGLSAAVTLADAGVATTLFDAARQLGGRARRVALDAAAVDNGQHILIGAYRETLRVMALVGADPDRALLRIPLELRTAAGFRLRLPRLPAPLHLALGLLTASGVSLAERVRAARFVDALKRTRFRLAHDMTVAQLLEAHRQPRRLRERLWEPLCISALNTAADAASAQVFANVLRDTLAGPRDASDLLLPRRDLGALFPDHARTFLESRGTEIRTGQAVGQIAATQDGLALAPAGRCFDAVIVATSPRPAASLLAGDARFADLRERIGRIEFEPIYTCYLQYPASARLPFPMLGFEGGLLQWAFDRGALTGQPGLVACVLSASGRHQALAHPDLAAALHAEIAAALPGWPQPAWSRVVAEKRATFACVPGLWRPANETPVPGVFLAGDYTASDYPATLESAVRSGVAAGRLAAAHVLRHAGSSTAAASS